MLNSLDKTIELSYPVFRPATAIYRTRYFCFVLFIFRTLLLEFDKNSSCNRYSRALRVSAVRSDDVHGDSVRAAAPF